MDTVDTVDDTQKKAIKTQALRSAQDIDEGNECGISIDGFDEWEAGDEARCFEVKLVSPELVSKK